MQQQSLSREEVSNVITHAAGITCGVIAFVYLLIKAFENGNPWVIWSSVIYGICMLSSFVTSTCYHACVHPERKRFLRKLDHSAIFLYIAGTYTPFSLIVLRDVGLWGWIIMGTVWSAAIIGIYLSFLKMKKKSHFKTVCYLAMGWIIVIAFKPLLETLDGLHSMDVLYWLIAGGACYTAGSVFFFLDTKYKYMHPVWHVFVLGGGICHFISVYVLIGNVS